MNIKSILSPSFRQQVRFFIVACVNLIYNILPFFILRNMFLHVLGVRIGKGAALHMNLRFFDIGKITIGRNSTVNWGAYLDSRNGIEIGNNVMIAHNVKIYTLGHDVNDPYFGSKGGMVRISDNAVVFANAIIMPSVTIGLGAVVYPGSVVVKNVEPYTIVGGAPAKVVGKRNSQINYKIDYRFWCAL